jgi:ABC-type antimicrobial peptide transport system permease subunit
MAVLSGFLGALAALLAAIGLYGVISSAVLARQNEIGIRLALGATRDSVGGAVLRQGWTLTLTGTAIGILLALGAVASARALLFGLEWDAPGTVGEARCIECTEA